MTSENYMEVFQDAANELSSPDVDAEGVARKLEAATLVKEKFEAFFAGEVANFLKLLLSPLCQVLLTVPAEHDMGDRHRLRGTVLSILHRIPTNEALKPHAARMQEVCLQTLREDNEENAIVAIHMLFDLHKNFRPDLSAQARDFLEVVRLFYDGFPPNAAGYFGAEGVPPEMLRPECIPATRSFQLVVETPLIIMFLCQVYKQPLVDQLRGLVPLMIRAATCNHNLPKTAPPALLKILGDFKWAQIKTIQFLTYLVKDFTAEIVPQRNAICDATAGLLCTAPDTHAVRKELLVTTRHMIQSKELQEGFYPHLAVFLVDGNLVGRQTLTSEQLRPMAYSLLAELVHHMRETLTAAQLADVVHLFCCLLHDPSIPPSIATTCVRLLLNLVQTIYHRRAQATPEDRALGRHLLMKILNCYATVLPAMARGTHDLLEEVRVERNHRNAVRDMLLEGTGQRGEGDDGEGGVGGRGGRKSEVEGEGGEGGDSAGREGGDGADGDGGSVKTPRRSARGEDLMGAGSEGGVERGSGPMSEVDSERGDGGKSTGDRDREKEKEKGARVEGQVLLHMLPQTDKLRELNDRKHMLYMLLTCMKTLLFGVTNYDRQPHHRGEARGETGGARTGQGEGEVNSGQAGAPQAKPALSEGITPEEVRLVSQVLLSGMEACALYWETEVKPEAQGVYYLMAEMLSVLERRELHLCLVPHMEAFVSLLSRSDHLLHIVVHLLMSENANQTAQAFTDVLAGYLFNEKLAALDDVASRDGALVLRLFQMLFGALTKHPAQLRGALQPRICALVDRCLHHMASNPSPMGYVQVLRAVFRALQGGRNVAHLKPMFATFLPALEGTIRRLSALLAGPCRRVPRASVVELLLMLPAELSDQLEHLRHLVRPLLLALRSTEDHVLSLGLKTLEFWIDNLNPEFLEMTMGDHQRAILAALWDQLRPGQIGFSAKALQILGKLGGRNRRVPREVRDLEFRDLPEHGMRIILTFEPSTPFLMPVDKCVRFARSAIRNEPLPARVPAPASSDRGSQQASQRKPPERSLHNRTEAAKFIRMTLVRSTNLRDPADSALACATPEDKVKEALLGPHGKPRVPPLPMPAQRQGIPKTKVQYESEKDVLRIALTAALEAAADAELCWHEMKASGAEGAGANAEAGSDEQSRRSTGPGARDLSQAPSRQFAGGLVRHAALLMAAGATTVALPTSTDLDNGIDAEVHHQSYRQLSPALVVDALAALLTDSEERREYATTALQQLLRTVLVVVEEQRRLGRPMAAHESEFPPGGKDAAGLPALPPVPAGVQDVVDRVTHLCYSQDPAAAVACVEALAAVCRTLPREFLEVLAVPMLRAMMAVLDRCPGDGTVEEIGRKAVRVLMRRCAGVEAWQREPLTEAEAIPACMRGDDAAGNHKAPQSRPSRRVSIAGDQPDVADAEDERGMSEAAMAHLVSFLACTAVPTPLSQCLVADRQRQCAQDLLVSLARGHGCSVETLLDSAGALFVDKAEARVGEPSSHTPSPPLHLLDRLLGARLASRYLASQAGLVSTAAFALACEPPLLDPRGALPEVEGAAQGGDAGDGESRGGAAAVSAPVSRQAESLAELCLDALALLEGKAPEVTAKMDGLADRDRHLGRLRVASLELMGVLAGLRDSERLEPVLRRLDSATAWGDWPEAEEGSHAPVKRRMVMALFRALSADQPLEVAAARRALLRLNVAALPKTLVRHSLDPLVSTISSMHHLSLPVLRGTAHALEILGSSVEAPELTRTILAHMEMWLKLDTLVNLDGKAWKAGQEAQVAAAILHLFPLLPPSAEGAGAYLISSKDRVGLIVITIQLELALLGVPGLVSPGRLLPTPFRLPLIHFINKHTRETVDYFLAPNRFASNNNYFIFTDILRAPHGAPLLDQLAADPSRLLAATGLAPTAPPDPAEPARDLALRGLELIAIIAERRPAWLAPGSEALAALRHRWAALPDLERQALPHLRQHGSEVRWLIAALCSYLSAHRDPPVLLDMVAPLRSRLEVDLGPLRHFLGVTAPALLSPSDVADVVRAFTARLAELHAALAARGAPTAPGDVPSDLHEAQLSLALALRHLLLPCLRHAVSAGTLRECLPDPVLVPLLDVALERTLYDGRGDGAGGSRGDAYTGAPEDGRRALTSPLAELAEQLMDLMAVLMEHMTGDLHPPWTREGHREDGDVAMSGDGDGEEGPLGSRGDRPGTRDYRRGLIRLPWHFLTTDHSPVRFTAFVTVCRFMKHMPKCPGKIYLQIYMSLIKQWQPEGRAKIREALDILTPLMPLHPAPDEPPTLKYPQWIRWTKRTLMEEGHSLGNLVHILQLICRHHLVFAPWRNQLTPLIIQALQRLGIPQHSPLEYRKLSIDLIEVILDWEAQAKARAAEGDGAEAATPAGAGAGQKRPAEAMEGGADPAEPPAQLMRASSGAAVPAPPRDNGAGDSAAGASAGGGASSARAAPSGASYHPALLPAQAQYLVSYCQRMALMIFFTPEGKPQRIDRDLLATHAHTLRQISRVLDIWPETPVKFGNFLEKHLTNDLARRMDPPVTLITGLATLQRVLAVQGWRALEPVFAPATLLLKHALNSTNERVPGLLTAVLRELLKGLEPYARDNIPPAVRDFLEVLTKEMVNTITATQEHLQTFIERQGQLATAVREGNAEGKAAATQGVESALKLLVTGVQASCGVLRVIEDLSQLSLELVDPFLVPALKLANMLAREHIRPFVENVGTGQIPCKLLHTDPKVPVEKQLKAEYGTAVWLVATILRVARRRVLQPEFSNRKKTFVHTLVLLVSDSNRSAQHVHPALLLELLDAVRFWVDQDEPEAGRLSTKEVVGSLQRLASLDRNGCISEGLLPAWEPRFLPLVYRMCTVTEAVAGPEAPALRADAFNKVERIFLCGLKARDPALRARFLALYTDAIPRNIHQRLKFCVESQDWEALAGTFWLQHAVAIHLDIVRTEGALYIAPNSSVFPPLLAGTRPLVFPHKSRGAGGGGGAAGGSGARGEGEAKDPGGTQGGADGAGKSAGSGQGAGQGAGEGGGARGGEAGPVTEEDRKPEAMEVDGEGQAAPGQKAEGAAVGPEAAGTSATQASAAGAEGGREEEGEARNGEEEGPEPEAPIASSGPAWEEVSETVRRLCLEEAAFTRKYSDATVAELVQPLSAMAAEDVMVAHHVWVLLFPIMWSAADKQQQYDLAKPIINLLSKEYHVRQAAARPNVVQALLDGISLSMPQPKIPAELFRFLGRTFNAWNLALTLVESHVLLFPDESRCLGAAADLYRALNETDFLAGLWKTRCSSQLTRAALSRVQLGLWEEAQAALYLAVELYSQGQMKGRNTSKGELSLWIEHWVESCRQLNQWDTLMEYGKSLEHQGVLLDVVWKVGQWDQLQHNVLPRLSLDDSPGPLLVEAQLHLISTGDFGRADVRMTQALHAALANWWQLPEVGADCHAPLLQDFQRLVEVIESKEALTQLRKMQAAEAAPTVVQEMTDLMATWRFRTPNEWEGVPRWADVLVWRNHIFQLIITSKYASDDNRDAMTQGGFNDKAWGVNRLASIARKHGACGTCVDIINSLYGFPTMQVNEAFVKIHEQAKAQMADPTQIALAFQLLNETNLSYFSPAQQAELVRLKGVCLERIGNDVDARDALSTAVGLHDKLGEGWLSWGVFCENATMRETLGMPAERNRTAREVAVEQAVACYLTSAAQGSPGGRAMMARVLRLLTFEDAGGAVSRAMAQHVGAVPSWVWLQWVPQLLASLQHNEMQMAKALLRRVVGQHPHALYLHLRAALMGLRALVTTHEARAATRAADGRGAVSEARAAATAFEEGKKLMQIARQEDPAHMAVTEAAVSQMVLVLGPRMEERLAAILFSLCQKCYRTRVHDAAEVPQALRAEIANIFLKHIFQKSPDRADLQGPVPRRLDGAMERDFGLESPDAPRTLGELIRRLKTWHALLIAATEVATAGSFRLEAEAPRLADGTPRLADLALAGMPLPGQHMGGADPAVTGTVFVERVGSDISAVRRNGATARRVELLGTDGASRHFLFQTFTTASVAAEERAIQLLRLLNHQLEHVPPARRRRLLFTAPASAPVVANIRLLEDDPANSTLADAYTTSCERRGQDPDMAILHFKRMCFAEAGELANLEPQQRAHQAFKNIAHAVSDNILGQQFYKMHPQPAALFAFKKSLCAQMGLFATFCFALSLGGRTPARILYSRATGAVTMADVSLQYHSQQLLAVANEHVPFRLTRNMQLCFSIFGVDGVFVPAMVLLAVACLQPRSNVLDFLHLFFRDDLTAWQADLLARSLRQGQDKGPGEASVLSLPQLAQAVERNVAQVAARVEQIAPAEMVHLLEGQQAAAPGRPRFGYLESDRPASAEDVMAPAKHLVDQASDSKNLCAMDLLWHPWF